MRSSRSALALGILFAGVLALLLWRYEPQLYSMVFRNPILVVLVVGAAGAWLALSIGHSVNDPKRAVLFKEGRFDRVEPGGRMLLWPGTEVGTEVSLAEQRVLGWPILVYDQKGAEVSIIFGLTWRIVPTSIKPSLREQRMLLSTNDERRRVVIQALETALRDIARCTTVDGLKGVLTNGRCVEAIRQVVVAQLAEDALTLDRLHVIRFNPPEKKDEKPVPVRNERSDSFVREVTGSGKGTVSVTVPSANGPVTVTGEGEVKAKVEDTRTAKETRGILALDAVQKPETKPDPNICCADCGRMLEDPNSPVMVVRFCKHCGGAVASCPGCGKQEGTCPTCGS